MEKKKKFKFTQIESEFIADNYKKLDALTLRDEFNLAYNHNLTLSQIKAKIRQLKITKRNISDNYGKYNKDMVSWLKSNYEKTNLTELTKLFNQRFNTNYTKSAVWHKINRLLDGTIDRTKSYVPRITWTNELIKFLIDNYDLYTYKKLSEMFYEKFNVKTTVSSIEHKINRLGLKKSPEGIKASSRLKKPSKYWFITGHSPVHKKPIGYQRIDKSGMVWIKTKEPDVFEAKQRVIYKMYHGEIKDGTNIVFLNGDKNDFRIENLIAMSNAELVFFNMTKTKPNGDDDIAKIKLAISKVHFNMSKVKKQKEGRK